MKQHKPYFMYLATAIQIAIFVYSLYYNYNLTKSWVAPFNENPMIGPSSGTLINLGARFLPCMKETEYLYRPILCPTGMTGTFDPANPTHCSLKDMCGFDMKSGEKPNQWYRFIVPIFLHGGIIHIIFNLSFQIRTGIQMEKDFGTWRIMIIYLLSGIFGFAFEAKSNGVAPSVGCSGSLYGLMACLLLDLIQSWKLITNPWTELFKMILIIIFSLGIGLLPNIDNYAHIGGFMMGILTGLIFLPSIIYSKRHLKIKRILMIISVFLSIFLFIWVFRQFYYSDGYCSWCHYLNCLPINHWCDNLTASAADIATNNP
ncbi:rhomboid-domain-containing protein [Anaeromyces robustus]|uniref:Rhomboid-type serine protease n=1 Tax=Anaeromyces robustus TaxID=1754192 RepID=A0A1Y1VRJ0_9FUNG|nr:rhomboid-domain-containing protein [Anaeromyces robustus]|eukprot:ORX63803.1 rhomboid-domain-containing protein [Anaeromyces robustus]